MMTYLELARTEDPVRVLEDLSKAGQLGEYFPELEALKLPIPAGYHHKDNWLHSLKVLDNALAREGSKPDYTLRVAALTHDVGKPSTRKFAGKGKVTFWNHETAGAKLMKRALKAETVEASFTEDVSHLISLHMRAYGFGDVEWSASAVRRLMAEAGSELQLSRLVTIFYADLTTANSRKKARVEGAIARLEDAFALVKEKDARSALRPALDGNEVMKLTGLKQGRELGALMRFLNSDEGVTLSREEALTALKKKFPEYF